ncbi:MAG TPA: hypothetical protein PKC39_15170 [Ferruginibacter sp.]|nr:hypothetical protein [Ferruginibacter sp.]HMP22299.1 hypothetical protein [Ferruginibacter sp.]
MDIKQKDKYEKLSLACFVGIVIIIAAYSLTYLLSEKIQINKIFAWCLLLSMLFVVINSAIHYFTTITLLYKKTLLIKDLGKLTLIFLVVFSIFLLFLLYLLLLFLATPTLGPGDHV